MKYLLMIYAAESSEPQPNSDEFTQLLKDYETFSKQVETDGVFVGGNALDSIATATTVKVRDGKQHITDGPFAETKEALGGYYLLDCKDLDQAIQYAAQIPSATYGRVEIRPIMTY